MSKVQVALRENGRLRSHDLLHLQVRVVLGLWPSFPLCRPLRPVRWHGLRNNRLDHFQGKKQRRSSSPVHLNFPRPTLHRLILIDHAGHDGYIRRNPRSLLQWLHRQTIAINKRFQVDEEAVLARPIVRFEDCLRGLLRLTLHHPIRLTPHFGISPWSTFLCAFSSPIDVSICLCRHKEELCLVQQ